MKFYFAPMEGVSGYIYRNAYHKYFHSMDRYFTPFIAPKKNHAMSSKEKNDVLPENNIGLEVIPQMSRPEVRALLNAFQQMLMVNALIGFGVVTLFCIL
ncbi:MAG: hypothetical protein IIV69_07190, partial [Peptococcaceae bacterium]|nr:hypothetical protein [Peptococcaceae bacterium]